MKKTKKAVEIEIEINKYQLDPSNKKLERLIRLNMGLVRRIAVAYQYQCPGHLDDLIQEGSLGLIKAINRFDSTKGNAFSSYAVSLIRGDIRHYIRDRANVIRVPRAWDDQRRKFLKLREDPRITPEEIQKLTGIKVGEQRLAYLALTNTACCVLDPFYHYDTLAS